MATDLTALTAEVEATRTVEESAITLITGLADALRAAGTDPVAIQAVIDSLDAGKSALAEAVTANTPSA